MKINWLLGIIAISGFVGTNALWADDTDLFAPDSLLVAPKIMLLLDTSGSMKAIDGIRPPEELLSGFLSMLTSYDGNCSTYPNQYRKICVMKEQLTNVLDANSNNHPWSDEVEVGIAQYAPPGAIILAPIAPLGDGSAGTQRAKLLRIVENLQPMAYSEVAPEVSLDPGSPMVGGYLELAEYLTSGAPVSNAAVSYSDSATLNTNNGVTRFNGANLDQVCGTSNTQILVITDGESACETLGSSHPTCTIDEPVGGIDLAQRISQFTQQYDQSLDARCNATITTNSSGNNYDNRDYFTCLQGIARALGEVKTQVIGLGLSSSQTDLNNHFNSWVSSGNGGYYRAQTGAELAQHLRAITQSLSFSRGLSMADAGFGVNQSNVFTHGEALYYSVVSPSAKRFWYGNLKKYFYGVDDDGNLDVYFNANKTNLAIDDEGTFLPGITEWSASVLDAPYTEDGSVPYVGGAAGNIPAATNRKLYTSINGTHYLLDGRTDSVAYLQVRDYMVEDYLLNNVAEDQRDTERPIIQARGDKLMRWLMGIDELGEWISLSNQLLDSPRTNDNRSERNQRRTFYGSALHSEPLLINYQSFDNAGEPLTEPKSLVFTSTNDGKLYAVDSKTGQERLSFIPQVMLTSPGANQFSPVAEMFTAIESNQSGNLIYGLDGSWTPWRQDVDKNGNIDTGPTSKDFVYLYGGMRRGGKNYFVLDVTKANSSSPEIVQLAEIQGGEAGTEWENSGQSWSKPVLGLVRYKGKAAAVFIVGGGYDPGYDTEIPSTLPTAGAQVYMVVARAFSAGGESFEIGDVLWWGSSEFLGAGNHQQIATMEHSVAATVKTLDLDSDGLLDHVYLVDMGGQIHRLDINNDYMGTGADSLVSASLVAQLGVSSPNAASNSDIDHRRFFYPPSVARMHHSGLGQFIGLAIGSGWRSNPKNTSVNEKFYFLMDKEPLTLIDEPTIVEGDVQGGQATLFALGQTQNSEALTSPATLANTVQGFALDLTQPGEKFLGSPLIVGGNVYFSTYYLANNQNLDRCEPGTGSAAVYSFAVGQSSALLQAQGLSQNVAGSVSALLSEVKQEKLDQDGNIIGTERTVRGVNLSGTGAIGSMPLNLQNVRRTRWLSEQ